MRAAEAGQASRSELSRAIRQIVRGCSREKPHDLHPRAPTSRSKPVDLGVAAVYVLCISQSGDDLSGEHSWHGTVARREHFALSAPRC